MWFPWSHSEVHKNSSAEIARPPPEELKYQQADEDATHLRRAWIESSDLPFGIYPILGLGAFFVFSAGWTARGRWDSVHVRYFKRIGRHYDVPDSYIREKRYLKGIVTSVPDGDGFSFLHTPGPGWKWPFKFRRLPKVKPTGSSEVIRMRMAAIDAPEMPRGEAEGQPFSTESRDWLRSQILGKTIYCQLLKRESQYGRMIVLPFLPRKFLPWLRGTNLSEEIIRRGWAFVYERTDGEFPHPEKREGYMKLMAEAQKAKLGIWKRGIPLETPAQYKKRTKQGGPTEMADGASEEENKEGETWFQHRWGRIFGKREL